MSIENIKRFVGCEVEVKTDDDKKYYGVLTQTPIDNVFMVNYIIRIEAKEIKNITLLKS